MLDISKEGKSRNLIGLVFGRGGIAYLNMCEDETSGSTNNIGSVSGIGAAQGNERTWKKGTCKSNKFLSLPSIVISIPLDSLAVEVISFGSFLAARIRRMNNFYFVFFTEVQHTDPLEDFLISHSNSNININSNMFFAEKGSDHTDNDLNSFRKKNEKKGVRDRLLPLQKFRRSSSEQQLIDSSRD